MPTRTALAVLFAASLASAETRTIPLQSLDGLKLLNVKAEPVTFKARKAIRLTGGGGR